MSAVLYRHRNETGTLLYVGVSLRSMSRLMQHSKDARWFDKISRVDLQHFADMKSAREAERIAILVERPRYNQQGVANDRQARELLPVRRAIDAAGSISALATALGITKQAVSSWTRVPTGRAHKVARITGVPLSVLRPDLFGAAHKE
jgi:hypothetical protein